LYFNSYVTPLHIAADKAHYDVMDVLLKHGAKVRIYISALFPRGILEIFTNFISNHHF